MKSWLVGLLLSLCIVEGHTQEIGGSGSSPGAPALSSVLGLDARVYGVTCDGIKLSDVTTTASSAVVGSASYAFVPSDVGKQITIAGAGASAAVLNTTIASVSGGNATLTAAAGTSIAGTGVATFGTDQHAAVAAASAGAVAQGGGRVLLPFGTCIIASSITSASQVSYVGHGKGKTILKWISASDMTTAMFQGTSGSVAAPYTDVHFEDLELDGSAATQATYNVAGKAFFYQYMLRPVFRNVYAHDFPATCIGVDYIKDGLFEGNVLSGCGRLNGGSNLGGAGIGIAIGSTFVNENSTVIGNTFIGNATYGVFFEAQNTTTTSSTFARVEGNYVYLTATLQNGIGDSGLSKFICVGNHVIGQIPLIPGDGISVKPGTIGGSPGIDGIIADNVVTLAANGISILYNTVAPSITPSRYMVMGNKILNSHNIGINVQSGASYVITTLDIKNNTVSYSYSAGLYLGGTAGIKDVQVVGNTIENNATGTASAGNKTGVELATTITRLRMLSNTIYDNQATQTQAYALIDNGGTVTAADIEGNDLASNLTGAVNIISGSITGYWNANHGYTATVSTLPPCATTGNGSLIPVTDATTPAYNAALTGGGAVGVPAYCNGSAWTAH